MRFVYGHAVGEGQGEPLGRISEGPAAQSHGRAGGDDQADGGRRGEGGGDCEGHGVDEADGVCVPTAMPDIDTIIASVKQQMPDVEVVQMHKFLPNDDDGLWWFRLPGIKKNIQIESSTWDCPFIVEHSDMKSSSEAEAARTPEEAVAKIVGYLSGLRALE